MGHWENPFPVLFSIYEWFWGYNYFCSKYKWNSSTKTSNCGLFEGKSRPGKAIPLKIDQIYPHGGHNLSKLLPKAVLRDRKELPKGSQISDYWESKSEGNFQGLGLYTSTLHAHTCFRILTAESVRHIRISFDHHYVRSMGRLGWNTYQTTNFLGSLLMIVNAPRTI